nr:MAG TPA: 40S ribosomal protein SA [Caudoviricetes sp.]
MTIIVFSAISDVISGTIVKPYFMRDPEIMSLGLTLLV